MRLVGGVPKLLSQDGVIVGDGAPVYVAETGERVVGMVIAVRVRDR